MKKESDNKPTAERPNLSDTGVLLPFTSDEDTELRVDFELNPNRKIFRGFFLFVFWCFFLVERSYSTRQVDMLMTAYRVKPADL